MSKKDWKSLTAGDIMRRDLIVVYDRDTLADAMALMTANHVTGLPVVNSQERCVGLISASDILNYEQEHAEIAAEANEAVANYFNPETQKWESVRVGSFALEQFGHVRVDEVMSADVVSVDATMPLQAVAKKMVSERIHRVLVLNDQQRLLGIITSMDFVQLFAELE